MELIATKHFEKAYKKLDSPSRQLVKKKLKILQNNPFHPHLKTHKLKGVNRWAFSVDYKKRVLFAFLNGQKILLADVGDHSLYQKI